MLAMATCSETNGAGGTLSCARLVNPVEDLTLTSAPELLFIDLDQLPFPLTMLERAPIEPGCGATSSTCRTKEGR